MNDQEKLLWAIIRKNPADVQAALLAGADPQFHYPIVEFVGENVTPLYIAVSRSSDEIADIFLPKKIDAPMEVFGDPARPNFVGNTIFHEAAVKGRTYIIKKLVEAGADIHTSVHGGETALHWAVMTDRIDSANTLLELGADPNAGKPGMFGLIKNNEHHDELAQTLIDAGIDVKAKDAKGRASTDFNMPMHRAASQHLRELADKLGRIGNDMPQQVLVENGKPTILLNHILGAHRLNDVFKLGRWKGREQEAFDTYDAIKNAVTAHYRADMRAVDMSALAESTLGSPKKSAVERFTRSAKSRADKPYDGGIG